MKGSVIQREEIICMAIKRVLIYAVICGYDLLLRLDSFLLKGKKRTKKVMRLMDSRVMVERGGSRLVNEESYSFHLILIFEKYLMCLLLQLVKKFVLAVAEDVTIAVEPVD